MTRPLSLLLLLACAANLYGFEWEGRIARLERDLASGDALARRDVVRMLGNYSGEQVKGALMGALFLCAML